MAAFVAPLIGAGISGLAGLFGNRSQTAKQSQSSQSSYDRSNNSNTTYNLNPFQQQLAQLFTQGASDLYKQSANLAPYTSQGLQQIAGQGAANNKVINNILAQRGLSFSPAAATSLTANAINQGQQMNSFLSGIPLLQRSLQSQSLDQLMQAFRAMPFDVGQTGYDTGHQSGSSNTETTAPGNMLGGLLSGLGAGLFAPNANGGSGSNIGAIIRGIFG